MDIENNSQVLGHELAMHVGCMVVSIPLGIKSSKPYQKKVSFDSKLTYQYRIGSGIRLPILFQ